MPTPAPAIAPAREGGLARTLQLDVTPAALAVHHLAQQDGPSIAKLRHEYETWEGALIDGAKTWRQHVQLREYLAAIEDLAPEGSSGFAEWAREHLDATDPRLRLPARDVPEWPHEERLRAGRYIKPQYGW